MDVGRQRVGIVLDRPVLDGNGDPVFTDLHEPKTELVVAWVDAASFEHVNQASPAGAEQQAVTETTTSDIVKAWLPVVDAKVPATTDGEAVLIDVSDINSRTAIRYPFPDGEDFQMRGDAQLMEDLDGFEEHVFCLAERQAG